MKIDMKLLYGKPVADEILSRLKSDISSRSEKPGLAVILVGDDKASEIYVALKEKMAKAIGMNFFRFDMPKDVLENEIVERIQEMNKNEKVHGIIVQLPLPDGLDTERVIGSIDPGKDADGFHPKNAKLFVEKDGKIWPVFPRAILLLAQSSGEKLEGKSAVVLANSKEFGEIMCAVLEREKVASQYVLAKNIPLNLGKIKEADVVVSAMGSPGLVRGEMLKEGAIVIDGGIDKVGEKVFGDVDFASTAGKTGFLTPVPGGVGPLTIACLLENVYLAFKNQS